MRLPNSLCSLGALLTLDLLNVFASATPNQKPLGGDKQSPFSKDFKNIVEETLNKWKVPGVSIGVIDGDDIWTEVNS